MKHLPQVNHNTRIFTKVPIFTRLVVPRNVSDIHMRSYHTLDIYIKYIYFSNIFLLAGVIYLVSATVLGWNMWAILWQYACFELLLVVENRHMYAFSISHLIHDSNFSHYLLSLHSSLSLHFLWILSIYLMLLLLALCMGATFTIAWYFPWNGSFPFHRDNCFLLVGWRKWWSWFSSAHQFFSWWYFSCPCWYGEAIYWCHPWQPYWFELYIVCQRVSQTSYFWNLFLAQ